jgi:hypothetical protein
MNAADTNGFLPPSIGLYAGNQAVPGNSDGGIFLHILPYVEQDNLFKASTSTGTDDRNAYLQTYSQWTNPIQTSHIKLYTCPSDPTIGNDAAYASYGANGQVFRSNYPLGAPTYWGSQPIMTYPASIPDGTSNTIFFTEKLAHCDTDFNIQSYPNNYWPDWGPVFSSSDLNRGGLGVNSAPQYQPPPSPQAGRNGVDSKARNCDGSRASTFHTGGFVTGMGDGSVRTIRPTVDVNVWWGALTPAGGEVPGNF